LTIWLAYLLAAAVVSGVVIAVGWRSRRVHRLAEAQSRPGLPDDPLWGDTEIDINASESSADVGGALRLALKRLAPVMASGAVKVDVAAPSGLLGRMRAAVLTDLLEELLTAAVHGAPGGRLLLTVGRHGDRIQVGVTDDAPGADPAIRAAGVRGLMERVALRGGTLDIGARPAEGTTMTLRFAAATQEEAGITDLGLPAPPKGTTPGATPAFIASAGTAVRS
jgi:signal transduction histidine kinase